MTQGKDTRRILFVLGDRDSRVTGHRMLQLVKSLAAERCQVDVVTCDEEVMVECEQALAGVPNVRYAFLKQDERFWTMAQRDGFAKTFIKLNHDMDIPGIDLKFWKMTGFDDFLWNTSSAVFPDISEHYDAVMMPIPSFSECPPNRCDVLYTHVIFHAKQNRIPVIGLQVYPICDIPPVFPRVIDHFVVKEEMEKAYYEDVGIAPERITIIDDIKDNYCLSTVQDSYRNLTIDDEFEVPRDSMGIVVVNHCRNRYQLYELLDVIGKFDKPKSVFFVFLQYSVKELHEQDIFKDLIQPALEKTVKSYYTVEPGAMIKSLMLCDVIVATNYIVPLRFAGRYGKRGIVYNPIMAKASHIEGVQFATTKGELQDALHSQYEYKLHMKTVADVVKGVTSWH